MLSSYKPLNGVEHAGQTWLFFHNGQLFRVIWRCITIWNYYNFCEYIYNDKPHVDEKINLWRIIKLIIRVVVITCTRCASRLCHVTVSDTQMCATQCHTDWYTVHTTWRWHSISEDDTLLRRLGYGCWWWAGDEKVVQVWWQCRYHPWTSPLGPYWWLILYLHRQVLYGTLDCVYRHVTSSNYNWMIYYQATSD